jgi:hypothetical protein
MVLPVLMWPPSEWYGAPLFPVLRNAQEHFGVGQLMLLLTVGLILGILNNTAHPLFLGVTSMAVLPAASLAEFAVDTSSHNLMPLELSFSVFYGLVVAFGIWTVRRVKPPPT